ncbi:hypothetical protein BW716_25445 [[Flexibacter] sp. ATCC 35208]|nr:hypothetical protein BW716_25445 [[Flexibacter] sp. ATCC 35208]
MRYSKKAGSEGEGECVSFVYLWIIKMISFLLKGLFWPMHYLLKKLKFDIEGKVLKFHSELFNREVTMVVSERLNKLKGKIPVPKKNAGSK